MSGATSLEWVAYRTTRDVLRSMADDGVFQPVGEDSIRGINAAGIVGRFAPKIQPERGNGEFGESNLPLPGLLITWIGHRRPETAGEIDSDDGVISMLIQLVDRLDRTPGDTGIESYMRWLSDVRERLQANPYRSQGMYQGDMYFVHVTESVSADNRAYIQDEARLVLQLSIFTRSRRDIGVKPHGT